VRFVGSGEEVFGDDVIVSFFRVREDFTFRDKVEDLSKRCVPHNVEHDDSSRRATMLLFLECEVEGE